MVGGWDLSWIWPFPHRPRTVLLLYVAAAMGAASVLIYHPRIRELIHSLPKAYMVLGYCVFLLAGCLEGVGFKTGVSIVC